MEVITTIKSGNWSDPSIWDLGRVPQDMDDVIISNGHTVIYDYDMSAWTNGLNSLRINGASLETRLKCHRTQNTYLKLYGNVVGSNWQYSIMDWGKGDDPVLAQAIIEKTGASNYIGGGNLLFLVYGQDPGIIKTQLVQNSPAGSNRIYVDISNGFLVQAGDEIVIEGNSRTGEYEIKTVQSINGNEITLTSALNYAKNSGNIVCKLTRNVKLISNLSSGGYFLYQLDWTNKTRYTWGNFYLRTPYIGGAIYGIFGFNFKKISLYAGDYAIRDFWANVFEDCVLISYPGKPLGINWNKSLFKRCYFMGVMIAFGQKCVFIDCELINSVRGIAWSSDRIEWYGGRIKSGQLADAGNIKSYQTILDVNCFSNSYALYHNTEIYNDADYKSTIFDTMNTSNDDCPYRVFAIQKGKNVFNWKGRCGQMYLESGYLKMVLTLWDEIKGKTEGVWYDWIFRLQKDIEWKIEVRVKKDRSVSENYRPRIQIFKKGEEFTSNPLFEIVMPDSVNSWETLTILFTPDEDVDYIFRIWAGGQGYNVWWDLNPCNDLEIQNRAQKTSYIPDTGERRFEVIDMHDYFEILTLKSYQKVIEIKEER